MPLLGKKKSMDERKFQAKMHLAKISPEPSFDLSDCDLAEVPAGTFSLVRVLRKEALLLHNNRLCSLPEEVSLHDLHELRVLDLHNNSLRSLPASVGSVSSLQVLNLERNHLAALPDSLGALAFLQTLNLRGNRLAVFPPCVCRLVSLRCLDVSDNPLDRLPKELCLVKTCEQLVVSTEGMLYPPREVCETGSAGMMRFLCDEKGIAYEPPSKFVLNVLEPPVERAQAVSAPESEHALDAAFRQYETQREQKRLQLVQVEQQVAHHQREQALLKAHALADRQHLVGHIVKEHERLQQHFTSATERKCRDRDELVQAVLEVERNSSRLIGTLLEMNDKARRCERLLEQTEDARARKEQALRVRQEELQALRKQEILASMEVMLQSMGRVLESSSASRQDTVERALNQANDLESRIREVIDTSHGRRQECVQHILDDERLQREALELLQLSKDARHRRVSDEIELVQNELAQLSLVEMEQRRARVEFHLVVMDEKRTALAMLLTQLIQEKKAREMEIREQLADMEAARLTSLKEYWLVQYQRLLDRKPASLVDDESLMEMDVLRLLESAGATEYKPMFARARLSMQTLVQMADGDLLRLGVHDADTRTSILKAIKTWHSAPPPAPGPPATSWKAEAPAQGADDEASGSKPRPPADDAFGECVICMDARSGCVFLPCGHVACCPSCAQSVSACPMCRRGIEQRVRLYIVS